MNRVTIVVGGVVVIVILVSGVALHLFNFGKKEGKPQTEIRLSIQGGVCKANEPDRLGGYHNDKVKWNVQNDCTDAQYVTITNYREKLDPADPTKLGPPDTGVVDKDPAWSGRI